MVQQLKTKWHYSFRVFKGKGSRLRSCDHHPTCGPEAPPNHPVMFDVLRKEKKEILKLNQRRLFNALLCLFLCETWRKTFTR